MEKIKKCFKCNESKPLSQYYKHKGMSDGHLNKCKSCAKKDVGSNYEIKSKDFEWIEKERNRCREKYKRLNYKEKSKFIESANRPYRLSASYKNLNKRLKIKKGHQCHHWSYSTNNLKDVFIVSPKVHRNIHKYINYNEENLCFESEDKYILDTREKHFYYLLNKNIVLL
jgi:hypothetical protein